jgi:hypothetical protein
VDNKEIQVQQSYSYNSYERTKSMAKNLKSYEIMVENLTKDLDAAMANADSLMKFMA